MFTIVGRRAECIVCQRSFHSKNKYRMAKTRCLGPGGDRYEAYRLSREEHTKKKQKATNTKNAERSHEPGSVLHVLYLKENRWHCENCDRSAVRKSRTRFAQSACPGGAKLMKKQPQGAKRCLSSAWQASETGPRDGDDSSSSNAAGCPRRKRGRAAPTAPD